MKYFNINIKYRLADLPEKLTNDQQDQIDEQIGQYISTGLKDGYTQLEICITIFDEDIEDYKNFYGWLYFERRSDNE